MKTHWILFTIFLTACSSNANENFEALPAEPSYQKEEMSDFMNDASESDDYQNDPAPTAPRTAPPPSPPNQRKRIYTANFSIQVENVEKSTERVKAMVNETGGYLSEINLTNSTYSISNNIKIRVPNEMFDSLLNKIGEEAIFVSQRRVNTQDVTQEYTDIEIRLRTKKDVRDRYIDILRNKAKTVQDVLKAEEVIRVVQEEIEVQEGRLRYLKDQISMSTINLQLYQEVEVKNQPNLYKDTFARKVGNALGDGWRLVQFLALGILSLWPIVIILALIIWQRKRIFRRKKQS